MGEVLKSYYRYVCFESLPKFSSIELNRIEVVFSVNVIGLIPINSCILFDGLLAFITFCDHSLGQKDTRTMNTF